MKGFRVFLSYDHKDEKLAHAIREDLRAAGFAAWDPVAKLQPGDNWALEERDIEYALGDVRFKGQLLPVVIRPVKEIPWILETLQVLRIEADPERGRRRVVEVLRRIQTAA